MTRPCKCRRISCQPRSRLFKPCGTSLHELQETSLTLDELEAIRLADLERLYQEEAASHMGVSRQTFGNIVHSAHGKIADALVNAKLLKIAGGVVEVDEKRFRCRRCRNRWQAPRARADADTCPKCHGGGVPDHQLDPECDRSRTDKSKER